MELAESVRCFQSLYWESKNPPEARDKVLSQATFMRVTDGQAVFLLELFVLAAGDRHRYRMQMGLPNEIRRSGCGEPAAR